MGKQVQFVSVNEGILTPNQYGRSFTLSGPSCSTPNGVCQFTGGANAGPCTDASGILDLKRSKTSSQRTASHPFGIKQPLSNG
jgi:hypothetical protein